MKKWNVRSDLWTSRGRPWLGKVFHNWPNDAVWNNKGGRESRSEREPRRSSSTASRTYPSIQEVWPPPIQDHRFVDGGERNGEKAAADILQVIWLEHKGISASGFRCAIWLHMMKCTVTIMFNHSVTTFFVTPFKRFCYRPFRIDPHTVLCGILFFFIVVTLFFE